MAQNKPSGFRFRLPWLLQPALATPPATAPEPPRTAVASTSAPKPPFRLPGRAPPRATPQPTSSPVSVASASPPPPPPPPPPPSPPVEAKSTAPNSPLAKVIEPVVTRQPPPPPKSPPVEAKSTAPNSPLAKVIEPVVTRPPPPPPPPPPTSPPVEAKSTAPNSPLAKVIEPVVTRPPPPPPPPPPTSPPVEAKSTAPNSPLAKVIEPVATRSTKETQTTSTTPTAQTIETTGPATPPQRPPSFKPPSPPQPSSPEKPGSQPSSPSRTATKFRDSSPPVSPSRMPVSPPRADSKPLSPSRLATQPHVRSKPSSPSGEPPQTRAISQPTSPVHVQPPPPPQPSPPPVTPTTTRRAAVQEDSVNHGAQPPLSTSKPDDTKEIKKSTEITNEKFPVDSYHVQGADAKPKEMTEVKGAQTKSMTNPHSMEAKSPKPKQKVAAQVPLHREIKDDITKFIHKMATSHPKQYMDEKPASVITLAGDNKGASMHLGSDANKKEGAIDIRRGYKLDAIINGEGSSKGNKSPRESKASEDEEMKVIVNSNIQGINNSIMFNSSVTERNPGVHLAFSRTLAKADSNMENTEPMEMHKAEADITPPETLVYDPTTGRSLGGFFLEPTDSEPDDLEMFAGNYVIEVL